MNHFFLGFQKKYKRSIKKLKKNIKIFIDLWLEKSSISILSNLKLLNMVFYQSHFWFEELFEKYRIMNLIEHKKNKIIIRNHNESR